MTDKTDRGGLVSVHVDGGNIYDDDEENGRCGRRRNAAAAAAATAAAAEATATTTATRAAAASGVAISAGSLRSRDYVTTKGGGSAGRRADLQGGRGCV